MRHSSTSRLGTRTSSSSCSSCWKFFSRSASSACRRATTPVSPPAPPPAPQAGLGALVERPKTSVYHMQRPAPELEPRAHLWLCPTGSTAATGRAGTAPPAVRKHHQGGWRDSTPLTALVATIQRTRATCPESPTALVARSNGRAQGVGSGFAGTPPPGKGKQRQGAAATPPGVQSDPALSPTPAFPRHSLVPVQLRDVSTKSWQQPGSQRPLEGQHGHF